MNPIDDLILYLAIGIFVLLLIDFETNDD